MSAKRLSSKLAFFDVDTQRDFMAPSGALYVRGSRMISGRIRQLIAFSAKRGIRLFSSVDAHVPGDPEMKVFPPHCVVGTRGQQKIRGTLLGDRVVVGLEPRLSPAAIRAVLAHQQIIFEKQSYGVFDNPNTAAVLRAAGATRFVVFGVATDYCVRAAVLGLLQRGYRVTLVADAIRGVAPAASEKALAEMRKAGAVFKAAQGVVG
jgi:nicotinamidase/pyrazinamidase